ncbi:MAG: hypothetical protein HY460_00155 [Parcubacteria group bacterium]|nr:hypothetical protein [Parcubacteria group bacterium]
MNFDKAFSRAALISAVVALLIALSLIAIAWYLYVADTTVGPPLSVRRRDVSTPAPQPVRDETPEESLQRMDAIDAELTDPSLDEVEAALEEASF